MATIQTSIQLIDKVSSPIQNMISALDNMCSAYMEVQSTMDSSMDASRIIEARQQIDLASSEMAEFAQQANRAQHEQEELTKETRETQQAMNGLGDSIIGMIGAYGGLQAISGLVNLSDQYTQTTARLNLMNQAFGESADLTQMVFESAQRARGSYADMADTVARFGNNARDAFDSTAEVVAFAEIVQKHFAIAGASTVEASNAMIQLAQGLGSGVLRGDELNSIFEQAPNLIQSIADYMDVPVGKIREMASEGQITAEIVKNAMFNSAKTIDEQFNDMPMTWSQVWIGVMNELYMASMPLLEVINLLANNWSILEPIVVGVATAVGLYATALGIAKGIMMAHTAWTMIHTAFTTAWSTATFSATVAQQGLNVALLSCPWTWVAIGIIALIAVFYAVIAVINKFTGTSISATGAIAGAFAVAGAFIANTVIGLVNTIIGIGVELHNLIATFANFFANVFNDPVGAIINLFIGMFDFIVGIVESVAGMIDTILGSDLSGAIAGFRNKIAKGAEDIVGDQKVVMETISAGDYKFDRIDYGTTWNKGYDWGANLFGGYEAPSYDATSTDTFAVPAIEELLSGVGDIADATGSIADTLEVTSEDLKHLNDIAEREVINRFTTAEIKVDMTNNNNINKSMDIDGVIDHFVNGLNEALARTAEGVYA